MLALSGIDIPEQYDNGSGATILLCGWRASVAGKAAGAQLLIIWSGKWSFYEKSYYTSAMT